MTQPLYEIVYVSESCLPREASAQQRELDRILGQARSRNERDSVTGALLVGREHFAQVLEGRLGTLKATFERIQKDCRHSNVVVVRMAPIAARSWPNWSMSLHRHGRPVERDTASSDLPPCERSSLQELGQILSARETEQTQSR